MNDIHLKHADTPPDDKDFQRSVRIWVEHCFGETVADDIATRCFRFFEEAGELCQALGMRKEDALKLVEYTWGRPKGEPLQELGGAMVTLAALATPAGMLMYEAGWLELGRCWDNTEKIRAKQKAKAQIGLGADPIPGNVGKYVTLLMALATVMPEALPEGGFGMTEGWLPQQSTWQIIYEIEDAWIAQNVSNGIMGQYALPKRICSEPREKEAA